MKLSLSRRKLLIGATGIAASTMLFVNKKMAFRDREAKVVKVAVVGVGRRGGDLVSTLLAIPGVEVRAICDIREERAKKYQSLVLRKHGYRPEIYTAGEYDYENMIEHEDLDAVITATPWNWHVPIMVSTMTAGIYGATETAAAFTIEDCWKLVDTYEETGSPVMLLENVCYFRKMLAILNMSRQGLFGELVHAEGGYQHDVRRRKFDKEGNILWRGCRVCFWNVVIRRTSDSASQIPISIGAFRYSCSAPPSRANAGTN